MSEGPVVLHRLLAPINGGAKPKSLFHKRIGHFSTSERGQYPARVLLPAPTILLFLAASMACSAQPASPPEALPRLIPAPQSAGGAELALPRYPTLSPDGSQVAFTHQGDLWLAAVADGAARRLTAHDAYDGRPSFSPDGQRLAFLSNRHGNFDLFVLPVSGGAPQRLTWNSESEQLWDWISDDRILIGMTADRRYERGERGGWSVGVNGSTPVIYADWGMQNADLSADGRWMAYERGHSDVRRRAYRGAASSDVWIRDFGGAEHRPLTDFDGSDVEPMITNDGETVYFLSDRPCPGNESGRDLGLWRVARAGGSASLVWHPGQRSLRNPAISADGRFAVAELDAGLVLIDLTAGSARPLPVTGTYDPSQPDEMEVIVRDGASQIAVAPDGESIAFVARGDVHVLRRNEDIQRSARVTSHLAPDGQPVWVEEGKALLFVSERDGNAEVYRVRPAVEGEPFYRATAFTEERLTQTPEDEFGLALSPDGLTLAWIQSPGRLVVGDAATLTPKRTVTEGFESPAFSWSPDGRWLAFSQADSDFNNEVYLALADVSGADPAAPGVQPFNLTRHPDDDVNPVWSPDGRKLAFTSRRMLNDETDVWVAWLRSEDLERTKLERLEAAEAQTKADKEKKEKKDKEKKADVDPLAGAWKGHATGPDPVPADGIEFTLTIARGADGSLTAEIASALLTTSLTSPVWDEASSTLKAALTLPDETIGSLELKLADGKLTGTMAANGQTWSLSAERLPEPKKAKDLDPLTIDFDELTHRVTRLTRREGNEEAEAWNADSDAVYFNASVGTRLTEDSEGDEGFFKIGVWDDKTESVEPVNVGSVRLHGKDLHYVKAGKIVGRGSKAVTYEFESRFRENRRDLREEVMKEAWRALDRGYYDPGFHGHDWAASLQKWLPIARAASTREDFDEMVNYMLGEMNSSHMGFTGARTGVTAAAEVDRGATGHLGVRWGAYDAGPGRLVGEVLPGGPAARAISKLNPGDRVMAVNGEAYDAQNGNWDRLLNGTAGRETRLTVRSSEGAEREVTIRPVASVADLVYEDFVRDSRARVEAASEGRLGYVHIEAMGTGSLLEFERALMDAGHGKDGLLIDVRENGGGWTTDMLLVMLMTQDHAITVPRGGREGYPQERRIFASWNKPIVVLCNENSYSNAEIFSWAIRTLKRGPIVGMPTYGAVISTGGAGLLDGSFVRLPGRGWIVADGSGTNMELNGCPPDHVVDNLPEDFVAGLDRQLEKAIEVGLQQLR